MFPTSLIQSLDHPLCGMRNCYLQLPPQSYSKEMFPPLSFPNSPNANLLEKSESLPSFEKKKIRIAFNQFWGIPAKVLCFSSFFFSLLSSELSSPSFHLLCSLNPLSQKSCTPHDVFPRWTFLCWCILDGETLLRPVSFNIFRNVTSLTSYGERNGECASIK